MYQFRAHAVVALLLASCTGSRLASLSGLDTDSTFSISVVDSPPVLQPGESGQIRVNVERKKGRTEAIGRIVFIASSAPAGLAISGEMAATETTALLVVSTNAGTPPGTYDVVILGTADGRLSAVSFSMQIGNSGIAGTSGATGNTGPPAPTGPASLSFTESATSFANPVAVGANQTLTVTLQNTGAEASGPLPALSTTTSAELQVIPGGTCIAGVPLAGGASCTISIRFMPSSFGVKGDTLALSASPGTTGAISVSITATGQETFTLTVTAPGASGSSKLTSTPGNIDCGASTSVCTQDYVATTSAPTVVVSQTTGTNSRFVGFSGDCSGSSCVVTMAGDRSVTGTWQPTFQASVTLTGLGSGTITSTSSPTQVGQFNCSSGTCTQIFDTNMSVTLTASGGSVRTWSGGNGCSGSGATCGINSANPAASLDIAVAQTLTVSVTQSFGTNGRVVSSPAGINCTSTGAGCTTAAASGIYTLTAEPQNPTHGFVGWGGDCASNTGFTCLLNMNANHTNVTATFAPYNIMFVTNASFNTLGGALGQDIRCQAAAGAVGLTGAAGYVAYVNANGSDAVTRMKAENPNVRGWVRPDGKPFSDTVSTNFDSIFYSPKITETGAVAPSGAFYVMTGSGGPSNNCSSFTSTSGLLLAGHPWNGTLGWSWSIQPSCSSTYSLFCFGTKFATPVRQEYTTGPRVFLTGTSFMPGLAHSSDAGRFASKADADTICREQAQSGGFCADAVLGNCKWEAYLSAGTSTAYSFISPANQTGASWVRLDGVQVAANASDFLQGPHDASLSQTVYGFYISNFETVWTGSASPNVAPVAADNCTAWTTNAGTAYAGYATNGDAGWWSTTPQACNVYRRFYCVEDL